MLISHVNRQAVMTLNHSANKKRKKNDNIKSQDFMTGPVRSLVTLGPLAGQSFGSLVCYLLIAAGQVDGVEACR